MNIVITNVYGYKNVGDGAILDSTLRIINKAFMKTRIQIHAATEFSVSKKNITVMLHPYGNAILTNSKSVSALIKTIRFVQIVSFSLFYTVIGKFNSSLLPSKGTYSYIKSLKEADLILGIGGGYIRTKNKYLDYFGLLLTLLPLFISHLFNKKVLYLPMSFGNFASDIHNKIAVKLLKKDFVIFRDNISKNEFERFLSTSYANDLLPDLALFDRYKVIELSKRKNYLVLTARTWLNDEKQKRYEEELAKFVNYSWNMYQLKTVFLPMAWNSYEDDDRKVANRIRSYLKNKSIFSVKSVHTTLEAKKVLANAKIAVCTRLHSAILSTIVNTPFITMAYEYKTHGFLESIGLEKWNIDIQDVTFPKLQIKFDKLFNTDYKAIKIKLAQKHNLIIRKESELINILRNFSPAI
jgi:polysaccharide pyruvyl transferase WcaK-like protein